MKRELLIILGSFFLGFKSFGMTSPDWTKNATLVPGETRENIYQLNEDEFKVYQEQGYIHALKYPIAVTGLLVPYRPLLSYLKSDTTNPLKKMLLEISKNAAGFKTEEDLYQWIGLNKYNPPTATGIYRMPYPNGKPDQFYVGASIVKTKTGEEGLTFGCFTCHTGNLFGTTVMGLTNKQVRANEFFHIAKRVVPYIPNSIFKAGTGAGQGDIDMFTRTKKNLWAIGAKVPQRLGLDTSLPQVALSLIRRDGDEYATKNPMLEKFPPKHELDTYVADSKPMPWWTLKYKTRWLSDGSVVAGNPIFTNILWNEIGRGADLVELQDWLGKNKKIVDELTVAAFSTKAPRWTDFYPADSINLESAKRGEKVFKESCMKCHGEYQKAWNTVDADKLSSIEMLNTTKVIYHAQTPIYDVGTDEQRRIGMKSFANELNNLAISKWMKTVVEPQAGYVPPPLDGIWARYPYMHNNSMPNLCAIMTPPDLRPKTFIQGPANDRNKDYDTECVGYPVGDRIPASWKKDPEFVKMATFDVTKKGLSNVGHYKMFLTKEGTEKYTAAEKKDLREFLKTL